MKRGSSPGGKRRRAVSPAKRTRGRWGKVWLSPEFVGWCHRHGYKPEGLGKCIMHTFASENPGATITICAKGRPVNVDEIYDLPGDGKGTPE